MESGFSTSHTTGDGRRRGADNQQAARPHQPSSGAPFTFDPTTRFLKPVFPVFILYGSAILILHFGVTSFWTLILQQGAAIWGENLHGEHGKISPPVVPLRAMSVPFAESS